MVWLKSTMALDDWNETERPYTTQYNIWNGYVSRIPLLRQILDIRAASVLSSWRTKGPHADEIKETLTKMRGRGYETFKLIMANMYKIAWICGDAYAIKKYEGDQDKGIITDLEIIPSDKIRQVTQAGKILRYERVDRQDISYAKNELFHLRFMPRGGMTHGIGMIESMNNLLNSYEQIWELAMEIYERMSRPRELVLANTDNQAKINFINNLLEKAGDTWSGITTLPGNLITDVKDITLNPSLKPQELLAEIREEIFIATATPKIIMATGYANSEESLAAHLAGFRWSIRYEQEWLAENTQLQIFMERWPMKPPEIEYSYATEAQDERFERNLRAIPVIDATQILAPENKDELIKEALREMGFMR